MTFVHIVKEIEKAYQTIRKFEAKRMSQNHFAYLFWEYILDKVERKNTLL